MSDGNLEGESRRQAVRVTDRVLMSVNEVTAEHLARLRADFERGIPPYNQEGLTEVQVYIGAQTALAHIRQRDEDLGRFLQHLDTKINMLLQKAEGGNSPFDALVAREVSISSTGLSFPADESMAKGVILELNLVLLPDYVHIYCLAEVVDCRRPDPDEGSYANNVCCRYVLIMEEDREKLVQHNFRQQSLALRNRRLGKAADGN